ncbi:MAG: glycosyltransferase family 4 protein [Verrucomicrobia bacterium]|nr:glycosyltransferase family 4 protein [Verrucomicrobiota bacterium]
MAIDIQGLLRQKTGVGHTLYDLIEALAALDAPDEFTAFYFSRRPVGLPFCRERFRERRVAFPPGRLLSLMWKRLPFPPVDAFLDEADVVHFPDFVARPVRRGRVIVTVHDLSFLRLPETVEPKNRAFLSRNVPRSLERADAVIAVSDFTRRELEEVFPQARGKVHVIRHGVRRVFRGVGQSRADAKPAPELPSRYVLAVGTVEPRKNLGVLLDAMDIARRRKALSHVVLVVVGGSGWLAGELERRLAVAQQAGLVVRLGYVTDETLRDLYANAAALAFPTKYEGFGLPALEAMASGLPVVCSNVASLPEVVGDAGILVEDPAPGPFADALERVLTDETLAADLRQRGLERAATFTWERAARETLELYRQFAEGTYAHRR